ncbi:hypothetical protein BH20BAC1_BH20BAC1_09320 [soil metagenome]
MNPDCFYHIYNHANGRENLFVENRNYPFFMDKVSLYVLPFLYLHAYCLLPNHFHLLVNIKELDEIKLLESFKTFQKLPDEQLQPVVEKKISKAFANLFSSYTQSFNKVYSRKGSLFIPNMKAEIIDNEPGICNVVHYIHTNPIHHGFVLSPEQWKYSSYNAYLSDTPSQVSRKFLLDLFGGKTNFITHHHQPVELKPEWEG